MYYKNLLKALDREYDLGIQDLSIDSISLKVNDEYHISFYSEDNQQTVLIESDIYEIEPFLHKDFFQHLLSANFEGILPWGAHFGINPETNRVLLMKKILLEHIDYNEFIKQLKQFINLHDQLQEKLYHWKTSSFFLNKSSSTKTSHATDKIFI